MRAVCIHGHFYQPPRDNPWLGIVEPEASAAPWHDWNERITAECYAPNARAKLVAGDVVQYVDNYERISFNFGPTLLSWMKRHHTDTYEAILEADRKSLARFDGHGSAIAQAYNHTILPLADARSKKLQVHWGARFFEHCYGRRPEGMWLPETAVDIETLEALATEGLKFTILSPHQAQRVRAPGGAWSGLGPDGIDTTRPYRINLPSGAAIAVFFYDADVSQGVAFEGLLHDGNRFYRRLKEAAHQSDGHGIVTVATDGESYGHHHKLGEMALAAALQRIDHDPDLELMNCAAWLNQHPAEWEVQLKTPSAWSCAHGVERWRSDCGCAINPGNDWDQRWRQPLRRAVDHVQIAVATEVSALSEVVEHPEAALLDYVSLLLEPGPATRAAFLARHGIPSEHAHSALSALEMAHMAQLAQTSCGWFFDDIGGLEARQVLRYTGRAVELFQARCRDATLADEVMHLLRDAISNEGGDGGSIYHQVILDDATDLCSLAALCALRALTPAGEHAHAPRRVRVIELATRSHDIGPATVHHGAITLEETRTARQGRFEVCVLVPDNDPPGAAAHKASDELAADWLAGLPEAGLPAAIEARLGPLITYERTPWRPGG